MDTHRKIFIVASMVLVISFIGYFVLENSEYLKVDSCLDSGGRYDYEQRKCEYYLNVKFSMNQITGSQAITFLAANCIKVTADESGWEILYKEKAWNKYWVLTYPNSQIHGGGEPLVSLLENEEAKLKFNV